MHGFRPQFTGEICFIPVEAISEADEIFAKNSEYATIEDIELPNNPSYEPLSLGFTTTSPDCYCGKSPKDDYEDSYKCDCEDNYCECNIEDSMAYEHLQDESFPHTHYKKHHLFGKFFDLISKAKKYFKGSF